MILSNATLFPGAILPLNIFEPRYRRMLSDVLESHRMFAIAMRRPGTRREVPMPVACLGVVRVCVGAPDGTSNLLLLGLKRIQCVGAARYKPYRVERIEPLDSTGEEAPEVSGLRDRLLTMVKDRLGHGMNGDLPSALPGMMLQSPVAPPDTMLSGMTAKNGMDLLKKLDTAHRLADFVASTLLRNPLERLPGGREGLCGGAGVARHQEAPGERLPLPVDGNRAQQHGTGGLFLILAKRLAKTGRSGCC